MKSRIFLILMAGVFLLPAGLQAQRKHYFYYGKIFDLETHKVLPNVNFTFERRVTGTNSDEKGEFSFYIDTIPAIMIVSSIGYETRRILLDRTSFELAIYLQPSVQNLPEVVIKGKTDAEPFFRQQHYSVYDFDILNDTVFMLVYRNYLTQSELLCMSLTGDTLAKSGKLSFAPRRIFLDCIGFMHVISADSAYQLFVENGEIRLIYPVSLRKFNSVLGNCVLSSHDKLFIRKSTQDGLGLDFYGIDRKTFQRQMLISIADSEKVKMIRRNPDDAILLRQKKAPDSRTDFVNWSYVHKILYRPLSSEICLIGDFISIFNNSDGTIEFYKPDGGFSSKMQIRLDEVKDLKWGKIILPDNVSKKIYTLFGKSGFIYLYRVNMNTGQVVRQLQVEQPYPQKMKVYKGFLYYLYSMPEETETRILYRQKI
jgi:hypothetical protein